VVKPCRECAINRMVGSSKSPSLPSSGEAIPLTASVGRGVEDVLLREERRSTWRRRPDAGNQRGARAGRLLAGWQTLRNSFSNHPEFRERARDLALKKATGRKEEK
jgi:hypothetical protein